MNNLVLTHEDRSEMKQFYLGELETALRKVKHIKTILFKLNDGSCDDEENPNKKTSLISTYQVEPDTTREKGTRGRKSLWGNYILSLLKEEDQPLSYTQIINMAVEKFDLPDEKIKNVKQAITNSAFRLRVTNKKIDTFGLPGKKERYLCLSEWFTEGVLNSDYQKKVA